MRDSPQLAEARGRAAASGRAAGGCGCKGWRILDRRVRTPARRGRSRRAARQSDRLRRGEDARDRRRARFRDRRVPPARASRPRPNVLMPRYAGPGDDIRVDVILLAPRHAARAISRTPGSGDLPDPAPTSRRHAQENSMSLTVAVQMDPLDSINIAGDSTFALMLVGAGARAPAVPLCAPRI